MGLNTNRVVVISAYLIVSTFCCFAQDEHHLEQNLTKMGFENVSITEKSDELVVVFENSAYKIESIGIDVALKAVRENYRGDKKLKCIVLNNTVPQLVITQEKEGDPWSVSQNVYNQWREVRKNQLANRSLFKVDLVVYPEFYFRNIKLDRMYELIVNLSPAVEISLWRGMMFTGQVIFPVLNQYGEKYADIRPGYVTVSQEFCLPHNWDLTASIGIFNAERFGVDLQASHTFKNERFKVNLRAAITGSYIFDRWVLHYSQPKRLTWSVGGEYYYPRYNLQFNVDAMRFIGKDYGVRGDVVRHFKYGAIGLYGAKSNKGQFSAGFHFAIALPPYKCKRNSGFRVNTADYFNLEYNASNEGTYRRMFSTSPQGGRSRGNYNSYYIKSMLN